MQLRTIFAGVFLAMANAALILERLNDVLLAQGVYDFKVTLTYKSLVEDQAELESALNAFNETCTALIERNPNLKCGVITSVWSKDTSDIANINTYIRYFFKTRTPRGFWSAIGAMDSDDRTRIDENMDKLRRNEERFNKNTEHQASAIEKIYNFVSNSTITMDKAVESNNKNFESLKTEIRNTLNRANDRDKDLYLEATLMEIGMWYNSMRQNLKLKQKTLIAILHAENTKSLDLAEIINPVQLIRTLDSEEATLNDNLTFPRRADGAIMPEILNTLHYYVKLTNDLDIIMTLQIPLVKKSKWYAYKGTIEPSITGNILTILHLEEDIIIKQENNWGYVLTQADYDNCDRIGDTRLCKLSNIERDLKQEDTCMAALYFRNITTTCKTKVVQLNHDIWLETANRNIWTYFTPNKLKVSVFTGKNVTETTIQGKGNIKLLPDMMIQTDSIRITHFSETQGETKLTYHIPHTDIPNISSKWKDKGIPSLSKRNKIVSLFDTKKLFDIGVEVDEIKNHRTTLENLAYAPLENPWTTFSVFLVIGGALGIFFLCFKGEISCFTRKTVIEPHIPNIGQRENRRQTKHTLDRNIISKTKLQTINEKKKEKQPDMNMRLNKQQQKIQKGTPNTKEGGTMQPNQQRTQNITTAHISKPALKKMQGGIRTY
ncbi:uncharacterized protein LOC131683118 isoform X1 [Topomyia yanbarensis]|uniref:uncharacterized protein LOC131683118 isoform X1 n=1 Tax=Topomyia yanbarensis TaxID=2498891 RepID=UPI00273ACA45|nr:uncharacterized protein LOC131683118 isoform X1 [Topomyia yanbarensis]XP_058820916.1 uncharacterized protein LOC131683118 isoform X1 [Topomyia yanbarensis]XP_058820917.1 uncharacterized protein LOC131683118 isoform X1 [Topomyia yanbarensis]